MKSKNRFRSFFFSVVIPSFLTIVLFIISIYFIIIPEFEHNILNRKREMIKELTNTAVSVLSNFENDERDSLLTRNEAQKQALSKIEYLRYGEKNKDYFWITDMRPFMIMHPYRKDLNGNELSSFEDAHGKKLFVEIVDTINSSNEGFVDYMWQWKDDTAKIVPKLSYVKLFEPWGWIIGTGIYIEDVKLEIKDIENRLLRISILITGIIILLLLIITYQSYRIEKKRIIAEYNLSKSREKYKTLVEASMEGTLMVFKDHIIYSNKIIEDLLGYSKTDLYETSVQKIFVKEETIIDNNNPFSIHQAQLIKKNSKLIDVEIATSKMQLEKDEVFVLKVKEQSRGKKEFGKEMNKFKLLTDNINLGIFRATLGRKSKIIDANPALLELIGVEHVHQLSETSIFDLFNDKVDKQSFLNELNNKGSIKNKVIRLRRQNATINTIAVSAVLVQDENGEALYCDGVIEDITEQKQILERQENLIMELQTSLLFLSQPLRNFTKEISVCSYQELVSATT
ncbi:MAG: PAS domain-containing protein, partial [Bacteroidales bacterium]|nr:PAS domain-containing protein [Bacteroidales bacterium]